MSLEGFVRVRPYPRRNREGEIDIIDEHTRDMPGRKTSTGKSVNMQKLREIWGNSTGAYGSIARDGIFRENAKAEGFTDSDADEYLATMKSVGIEDQE